MSTSLLVTGGSGFVGRHVQEAVNRGDFGTAEMHLPPKGWDLRDRTAVESVIASVRPKMVLHLAAQSFVPRSFDDPTETLEINLMGTLNMLLGLRAVGFDGRLIYVSSGDVYGQVRDDQLPVDETTSPNPRSPYAVSKIAAEQLCLQWHRAHGLDVMIARPFNHIGPGQSPNFVVPSLAAQVAAIEAGRQAPVITAGDIDVTRDFTDVRDVVAAYAAMFSRGAPGATYVIGSGRETSIRSLLQELCALAGVEPAIAQDAALVRPSEQRRMCANPKRLQLDTGWRTAIPVRTTLQDILIQARKSL